MEEEVETDMGTRTENKIKEVSEKAQLVLSDIFPYDSFLTGVARKSNISCNNSTQTKIVIVNYRDKRYRFEIKKNKEIQELEIDDISTKLTLFVKKDEQNFKKVTGRDGKLKVTNKIKMKNPNITVTKDHIFFDFICNFEEIKNRRKSNMSFFIIKLDVFKKKGNKKIACCGFIGKKCAFGGNAENVNHCVSVDRMRLATQFVDTEEFNNSIQKGNRKRRSRRKRVNTKSTNDQKYTTFSLSIMKTRSSVRREKEVNEDVFHEKLSNNDNDIDEDYAYKCENGEIRFIDCKKCSNPIVLKKRIRIMSSESHEKNKILRGIVYRKKRQKCDENGQICKNETFVDEEESMFEAIIFEEFEGVTQ